MDLGDLSCQKVMRNNHYLRSDHTYRMTAIHLYTQLHILHGGPSFSVWLDTSMTLVLEYQHWVYKIRMILPKGAFKYYVIMILTFFDPPTHLIIRRHHFLYPP